MALLRNREVQLVNMSGAEIPSQLFTIQYPDGETEMVKLSELTLSEKESKEFQRLYGERLGNQTHTIKDSEYQDILDSQSATKIKEKQSKNPEVNK